MRALLVAPVVLGLALVGSPALADKPPERERPTVTHERPQRLPMDRGIERGGRPSDERASQATTRHTEPRIAGSAGGGSFANRMTPNQHHGQSMLGRQAAKTHSSGGHGDEAGISHLDTISANAIVQQVARVDNERQGSVANRMQPGYARGGSMLGRSAAKTHASGGHGDEAGIAHLDKISAQAAIQKTARVDRQRAGSFANHLQPGYARGGELLGHSKASKRADVTSGAEDGGTGSMSKISAQALFAQMAMGSGGNFVNRVQAANRQKEIKAQIKAQIAKHQGSDKL